MSGCEKCKKDCGVGVTGYNGLCCSRRELVEPALPDNLRTYYDAGMKSVTTYHPWRAPGYAPVSN